MEIRLIEVLAIMLVIGAMVLLWLRAITFEQALTLISIAISLVTGKYISRYEERIIKLIRR